jgi:hypothetical protein
MDFEFEPFNNISDIINFPEFHNSNAYQKSNIICVDPYYLSHKIMKQNKDISEISDIDLFEEIPITEKQLRKLRKSNYFLFLNFINEGTGYKYVNLYKMLTNSAIKHDIPLEKIFLISGNILEEEVYAQWKAEHSPNSGINVFCNVIETHYKDIFNDKDLFPTLDQTVEQIRQSNNIKHFLSFNNAKKPLRTAFCYLAYNSRIKDNTFLSYNKFDYNEFISTVQTLDITLDDNKVKSFCDNSPSILDLQFEDYGIVKSFFRKEIPIDFYKRSLISLVTESLHETWDHTSLCYTEKTFKSMMFNHPIMIIGQQGINKGFPIIRYKTYNNYFNLDFDNIEDHKTRLEAQFNQIEELNDSLNVMSSDQKIKWLLQDVETIHENKRTLINQVCSKKFIERLIKRMDELL